MAEKFIENIESELYAMLGTYTVLKSSLFLRPLVCYMFVLTDTLTYLSDDTIHTLSKTTKTSFLNCVCKYLNYSKDDAVAVYNSRCGILHSLRIYNPEQKEAPKFYYKIGNPNLPNIKQHVLKRLSESNNAYELDISAYVKRLLSGYKKFFEEANRNKGKRPLVEQKIGQIITYLEGK